MLPAAARLRRRTDFELTVRRGRRAGRPLLVVHAYLAVHANCAVHANFAARANLAGHADLAVQADLAAHAYPGTPEGPARIGFVVGRNVGGSVVRHRVQRRLRHLLRDRLDTIPSGTLLVVRALPAAAAASSADLAGDLDAALGRLRLKASPG